MRVHRGQRPRPWPCLVRQMRGQEANAKGRAPGLELGLLEFLPVQGRCHGRAMSYVYWAPWAAEWLKRAAQRRALTVRFERRLRRNREWKRRKRRLQRGSKRAVPCGTGE